MEYLVRHDTDDYKLEVCARFNIDDEGSIKFEETDYNSILIQDDPKILGVKIAELASELGHLRKTATESPARWCVNKAKREVFGADA